MILVYAYFRYQFKYDLRFTSIQIYLSKFKIKTPETKFNQYKFNLPNKKIKIKLMI